MSDRLKGMYPVVLCGKTIPKQYLDECVSVMEDLCFTLMAAECTGNTAMIREASEKRDKAYSRLFELYGLNHTGTTQHEIDLLLAVNEYVSVYGVVPEELFSGQFINGLMRKIRDNQTPATGTAVGWFPNRDLMREWS